ncbi:MAG: purine-binding chemotaxis protein CheW [Deltaproteobacteria bacterium]|nr:purine-binding chemotaxis protein CheW [Deltaproteobacteria bacterium]
MNESEASQSAESLLISTFSLKQALYGLSTNQVHEIVRTGEITPVSGSQPFVLGIMNLRGRIITILDLGEKIGLGPCESLERRILIVDWKDEYLGLVVDSVSDVVEVTTTEIAPAPANVQGIQSIVIEGVAQVNNKLIALLNLEKVLGTA